MQQTLHETTPSATFEACVRCHQPTQTVLPPRWVRWFAIGVAASLVSLPLAGPLLAADPVFAFIAYCSVGMALGPTIAILRTRGACQECQLDRPGFAIRRMGLRKYLMTSLEG